MKLKKVYLQEWRGTDDLSPREKLTAYEGWMEADAKTLRCVVVRVKRIASLTQRNNHYVVSYIHQSAQIKQKLLTSLAMELLQAALVGKESLDDPLLYFYVGGVMISEARVVHWHGVQPATSGNAVQEEA